MERFLGLNTRDTPITVDDDQDSTLTSLISGATPTLEDGIEPSMQELVRATKAQDRAAYDLVINCIPHEFKVRIGLPNTSNMTPIALKNHFTMTGTSNCYMLKSSS